MSQNFRASYTETLGKLETQYCKLMVSGLRAGLQQCPGSIPAALLRSIPTLRLGRGEEIGRLQSRGEESRFVVFRKPQASG